MIISQLTEIFLNILYRRLAIFYDFVAFIVSCGQWKNWVTSICPHLSGDRILELGFGTGNLMKKLLQEGKYYVGVDVSPQMIQIARNKFRKWKKIKNQIQPFLLIRANTLFLPFSHASFDIVVATFPTNYIFHPQTLAGIKRILRDNGQLLVILSAEPRRSSFSGRLLSLIYRITGQSGLNQERTSQRIKEHLKHVDFKCEIFWQSVEMADLLIIKCSSPKTPL